MARQVLSAVILLAALVSVLLGAGGNVIARTAVPSYDDYGREDASHAATGGPLLMTESQTTWLRTFVSSGTAVRSVTAPSAHQRPMWIDSLERVPQRGQPDARREIVEQIPCGGFVPGRVLVHFKTDVPTSVRDGVLRTLAIESVREVHGLGLLKLHVSDGSERALVDRLRGLPEVDAASLDVVHCVAPEQTTEQSHQAETGRQPPGHGTSAPALVPRDPLVYLQWGLAAIRAPEAWDRTTGDREVIVSVLDSGFYFAHPDRPRNLLIGRDFVRGGMRPDDDNGHGTHVAGIVGAAINNGVGVVGVAPNVSVGIVKVASSSGRVVVSDLIEAITWAVDASNERTPRAIVNLSLGGVSLNPWECLVVDHATLRGALVVAAAGNDGRAQPSYPAACVGALGVGAVGESGSRAAFSNRGAHVGLVAPGVGIVSMSWPYDQFCAPLLYCPLSGTSMAAPFVAGVAGLVWSANPALKAPHVTTILLATAQDVPPQGGDDQTGAGIVDAAAAVGVSRQLGTGLAFIERLWTTRPADDRPSNVFEQGEELRYRLRWFSAEDRPSFAGIDVLDSVGGRVSALSCPRKAFPSGLGWQGVQCTVRVPTDLPPGQYTARGWLDNQDTLVERREEIIIRATATQPQPVPTPGPLPSPTPAPRPSAAPAKQGDTLTRLYLPVIMR